MTLRLAICAFAALFLLDSTPGLTAEPKAAVGSVRPADWAERVSHGLVLAKLSQDENEVVSSALKQMDEGFVKALLADPGVKKLEAEYPGFVQRYYAAARPELGSFLSARLPQLWQSLAEAYANEMTVSEIDGQVTYLRSPLGQKMQGFLADNLDTEKLLGTAVEAGVGKSGDPGAGQKELTAASGMALLYSLSQLSEAERTQFVAYMSSPTGKAAQRAGKGVMAALVGWMNADDPAAEAKMGEIARNVMAQMQKEKDAK